VHLTLGILRTSQAVSYAFSFFWLDGFAVPHPSAGNAGRWLAHLKLGKKESKIRGLTAGLVLYTILI